MKRKNGAKNFSLPIGVLIGVAVSVVLMLLLAGIGASLVNGDRLEISSLKWFAIIVWAVSAFIGTITAVALVKNKLAIVAGITGASIILILLCSAMLFFDGISGKMLTGIAVILAGGFGASVLMLRSGRANKKKKNRRFV
jgi:hypothetical protein